MLPKLIVEQKITAFTNKYMIYASHKDGSKGDLLAFAQQKKLAFKEKVTFYQDEAKTKPVFSFRAEKVMDVHGRYFVEDHEGKLLGSFKKEFAKSLLNSTWQILDTKGKPHLHIFESNRTLAVIRRFGGFVPILGPIVEIITAFIRYHFAFRDLKTNQIVGTYKKTTLFRDHYILAVDEQTYTAIDWRMFAAVAVALDALQSR